MFGNAFYVFPPRQVTPCAAFLPTPSPKPPQNHPSKLIFIPGQYSQVYPIAIGLYCGILSMIRVN